MSTDEIADGESIDGKRKVELQVSTRSNIETTVEEILNEYRNRKKV